MTTEANIEVQHLEGLEAVRWLKRSVLLAVKQNDLASAFFLLTKLQGLILAFLLEVFDADDETHLHRREYLSILAQIDHAISEVIS